MSRNAGGTYTAPTNSFNPAVEGTEIDEGDWNTTLDDVEAALTESVFTAGMGATDNQIVRTDGTSTKKVQGTGITIDDSNNVSGVVGLTVTTVTATTAVPTTIELGHASDTTLARSGAGDITIEGNAVYRAGGTDVPLADGGTGASLADPNADRVMFWDDSAGAVTWLTMGTNLTITGTQLDVSGGAGDVTAASNFGTDNVVLRSDGTVKGSQASGVSISDTNDMSGVVALSATTIELGHASDTTLARSGAGVVTIEGNVVYRAGGTDVALADGGTGASLADPNLDVVLAWDDSAAAVKFMLLADMTTEAAPATGDFLMLYGAEGDLRKVNWSSLPGVGGGISNIVEDLTPQLGGQLDVNGFALGDGTLELLKFSETASAVNEFTIANAATGSGPILSATGDDTNIDLSIIGKGTGGVNITTTNTGLHLLDTNASHDLIIAPGSDLTADRTLTITTGDAARTLDISAASVTISSFAATVLDDASAAAAATTLALGTGDSPQFTAVNLGHATDTTLARSAAGVVTIEGSVIKTAGRETIWLPAAAWTARTTNGAASGTTELATNDVMLRTFDFDQTTEEGIGILIAMPTSWNESTVTFVPYWTAASGSGGVVFGLAAYAFSNDDAMDTAVSGQQTSTDTLITANDNHVGPESSAITIGGTPATNDLVYFELTREVANGSDTLTADAKLVGIHVYITTNAATDA